MACAIGSGGAAGSNATAIWAAKLGMNLQSSTLKNDETGEAFHVQQAAQIRAYRAAWKEAGHAREPTGLSQPQHLRADG
jgi:alkanesulfonate monooxygenase SsuD/methylene tetrahydromethanopterin reductase-like flavin-dependent oxidoreductase (luciferase family)